MNPGSPASEAVPWNEMNTAAVAGKGLQRTLRRYGITDEERDIVPVPLFAPRRLWTSGLSTGFLETRSCTPQLLQMLA